MWLASQQQWTSSWLKSPSIPQKYTFIPVQLLAACMSPSLWLHWFFYYYYFPLSSSTFHRKPTVGCFLATVDSTKELGSNLITLPLYHWARMTDILSEIQFLYKAWILKHVSKEKNPLTVQIKESSFLLDICIKANSQRNTKQAALITW